MDKYDKVDKLKKLLDEGAISQAEFDKEKDKVLSGRTSSSSEFWGMQENEYCMFMHLSQLLGMVIPFAGLVMPIVMWATAKEYSSTVDNHGKIIFNWIISAVIYFIVSLLLIVVIIGFPLMFAIMIVNIVFAIIGAIKARSGEEWNYPMSIQFFKRSEVDEALS